MLVCPAIFGHLMGFVPCWCTSFVFLFGFTFKTGSCSLPCFWQMLLPLFYVVDAISTRPMLCLFLLAGVLPILFMHVADVIAISLCGRCYCHLMCLTVAGVIAIIHCLANVIAI